MLKALAQGEAPSSEVGATSVADPPVSREQLRSRRKREVRARTVSVKRLTRRELELGRLLYPADEHDDVMRPKTRAECADGPRPCPFVSCTHHLFLDVKARTGAIKLNFPDLEPHELSESCALDVAGKGGVSLEDVGAAMNLTRERIRQMEVKALAKVKAVAEMSALRDHAPVGARTKRRLPILAKGEDGEESENDEDADASNEVDPERFASAELDDDGR